MRAKRARLAAAGGAAASRAAAPEEGPFDDDDDEPGANAGRDAASADYARLRDELRASRKAAAVGSSAPAAAKSGSSMLTPLQEMRAKYKARAKELGKRETDTLAKLQAFQATLRGATAGAATAAAAPGGGGDRPGGAAVYSGQVLEDADDAAEGAEGGSAAWMAHRLKFKKHIDDAFRAGGGGGPPDDGLETIDPLREHQAGGGSRGHGGGPRGDRGGDKAGGRW